MRELNSVDSGLCSAPSLVARSIGLLATVTVVALGGCGSTSSISSATSSADGSAGAPFVSVSPSLAPATTNPLHEISDVIYGLHGSSEQHLRQVREDFEVSQGAFYECMAKSGFDYPIPQVDFGDYGSPVLPLWYVEADAERAKTEGFGIVVGNPWTTAVVDKVPQDVYDAMSAAERSRYDATLSACPSVHPGGTDAEKTAVGLSFDLEQSLEQVLTDKSFSPVVDQYSACMKDKTGFAIDNPFEASDVFNGARATGSIKGTPQEVELAVALKEAECRAPFVDKIAALVVPAFRAWMSTNSDRVQVALESLSS